MALEKVQIGLYIDEYTENTEYFDIKDEYMSYIHPFRENTQDQFIGGMPVQLQKDCMSQLLRLNNNKFVYGITLKVNGTRHLMFLSKSGTIYFIDRLTNFFYLKRPDNSVVIIDPQQYNPEEFIFLFDGELVQHKTTKRWEFLIFDVIFYKDKGKVYNWISHTYYDRLYIMDRAMQELPIIHLLQDFDITLKTWISIEEIKNTDNIYDYVKTKTNIDRKRLKRVALEEDGLIIQPFDTPYVSFREWNQYNNVQFKWKPPNQLTVDFEIRKETDKRNSSYWWLLTKSEQNYDVKQDDGTTIHAIVEPSDRDKLLYNSGDIVECKLKEINNPQRNKFVILFKRADKKEANSLQTIMSTLSVVNNPFTLDLLKPAITSINTGSEPKEVLNFFSVNRLTLMAVDMFFTDKEIKKINEVYSKYLTEKQSILPIGVKELEFRIFPYKKKGQQGKVNKFTYYYLLGFLKKSDKLTYDYSVDILHTRQGKTYRSTYRNNNTPINQIKTRIIEYTAEPDDSLLFPLTFKLSLSLESDSKLIVTEKMKVSDKTVYNKVRVKHRHSFQFSKLWRIDITRVITPPETETYEIECEYTGGEIPFQTFINSMNEVYKLILGNVSYC